MDWRVVLLSAVAVIVLVAIFYSVWSKGNSRPSRSNQSRKKSQNLTPKEPTFKSAVRPMVGDSHSQQSDVKDTSDISHSDDVLQDADDNANPKHTADNLHDKSVTDSQVKSVNQLDANSDSDSQGMLVMDSTQAPSVPEPTAQLFPLEICYVIRLFGTALSAPTINRLCDDLHQKRRYYALGYDDDAKCWRLRTKQTCTYWLLATPLADRGGPLIAADIRQMEEKARTFAQKEGVQVVFSPAYEALENATYIDRFCEQVDRFIELRLHRQDGKREKLEEALHLAGLHVDEARRYYVLRERSELLFRAKIMPSPASGGRQTIIFEMDAPNVSSPSTAFDTMLQTARRTAQILDMTISDPRGMEIDEARATEMRKQLDMLSEQMHHFGAAPGGMVAGLIFA